MKVSSELWKEQLKEQIRPDWAKEIEDFETTIALRTQNKVEEKLFAETRLRRGVYGQRYDNGLRHDGIAQKTLNFEEKPGKGPGTVWDAPGMQRIKVPYGGLTPEQMEVIADLTEEYSDGIAHVTTRQDFQLHYIHLEDTPSLHRRLAAVGITVREACGNSVRNVTACPYSGVCPDEKFDITPYAHALTYFLLGHPDVQDFGRKFKPAFSGCKNHACGLTNMHDLGLIATSRIVDGKEKQGFEIYVGGGLGAVPHQAKLLSDFVPLEELLPLTQSIARVFARLGEKQNRNRARLKFLIKDLGIEKFKELVLEERQKLPHDPRWTEMIQEIQSFQESAKRPGGDLKNIPDDADFKRWLETNIRPQRQSGYVTVTIALPLGDITPNQLRELANIVRKYTKDTIRTSVEQNMVLRWISKTDLWDLYQDLKKSQLSQSEAGHIMDIVACPATDTCKLGVASSRGLAGELRKQLAEKAFHMDEAIKDLHIKVSGCFNSCGQQHLADLGFYGVGRKVGNYMVPHFQVVLGGQWENNGGSYGLPIVAIPSKNIPAVVDRISEKYLKERNKQESFQDFIKRIGKLEVKKSLEDLSKAPSFEEDPSFYNDWGDPRVYTTGDIGIGECAGEVVNLIDFDLADAEREVFEAQVLLDEGKSQEAGNKAYWAMLHAAKGLVKTQFLDVKEEAEEIIQEFRKRFYDTELFFDPFAKGKFAQYLFETHQKANQSFNSENAHHTIEEAQLFIEAVHACNLRMSQQINQKK
ncbi:MAG: nitrite/sulfite reductase [Deltaproteobacteria bacterium]|nr:nitrite/sulfite reductase [Deltaproteobacteria bacterium]